MTEEATGANGRDNPAEPQKRLLAGKYEDPEELEKGYLNLIPEIQRWRVEAEAKQREAEAYREMLSRQPAQEVPSPFPDGQIDPDRLTSYIDKRAEEIANRTLKTVLEPFAKAQQAALDVQGRHPDFRQDEINSTLVGDPSLAAIYQRTLGVDPEAAQEMAYQAWKAKQNGMGRSQSKEKQVRSKPDNGRDATIPGGSGGSVESEGLGPEKYNQLLTTYYDSGDPRAFLRERFKGMDWYEKLADGGDF